MFGLFTVVESNFSTTETTYNLLNFSTSNVTGILVLKPINNIGEIIGMGSVAANSGRHNSKNFKGGSQKSYFLCQSVWGVWGMDSMTHSENGLKGITVCSLVNLRYWCFTFYVLQNYLSAAGLS